MPGEHRKGKGRYCASGWWDARTTRTGNAFAGSLRRGLSPCASVSYKAVQFSVGLPAFQGGGSVSVGRTEAKRSAQAGKPKRAGGDDPSGSDGDSCRGPIAFAPGNQQ
jgi:hypothetical protein